MNKKSYGFVDRPPSPYLEVRVRDGQDVMQAYRKLKKKLLKEGVLEELRDRRYFIKPSEKKKEKLNKKVFTIQSFVGLLAAVTLVSR